MDSQKELGTDDTLYTRLGEPAPDTDEPARTIETAAKETIDSDREDLVIPLIEPR
jgi:hypothetical protein